MGGGSEREREWLGEMISNKMPVFRNISPLASAFGWSFLPPNYILIKHHLLFDTSEKNQLLKSVVSLSLMRVLGCRQLYTSTLAFPTSWTSDVVNTSPSGANEVKCALGLVWPCFIRALEHAFLCLGAGGCQPLCLFGVSSPLMHSLLSPSLSWRVAWWVQANSWLENLNCEGFCKTPIFDSPQLHLH